MCVRTHSHKTYVCFMKFCVGVVMYVNDVNWSCLFLVPLLKKIHGWLVLLCPLHLFKVLSNHQNGRDTHIRQIQARCS